ncbi:flagellar filament capping protein FliD [Massilia sp. NR 4-1]|uniref:flagellar filament capping protein FliD n=1 Tax=Massilia sp. NR 4-1 TaxID=1678028 RepID=UPI00067D6651|nr:flagellar filament capping protein FliD [Massilia sp. NR 4-1]AKU21640.1 flagellar hook 2 domain-containing protein [Massilia sp. NR 4-1]
MINPSIISTMYGNSGSLGGVGTPSSAVYAKVERALASQAGVAQRLNTSLASSQTRLSGLGQLQSALADFQAVAKGLSGSGLSTSATSSGKGVLTVSSGATAKAGSYAVDVSRLAQGQVLTSETQLSNSAKIGTGAPATIKVEFGVQGDKGFTPGKDGGKSITIDSSNNTLDGLASAFKAAGIDASVVKTGGGFALAIKGADGEAQSMRISVTGDAALKDMLAYNGAANSKLTQTQAAQDALLTVNGKQVQSAGNTLDKAIDGLKLTLTGKGKTDITVTQDASQIASNVGKFVDAFNSLNTRLAVLQKGDLKSGNAVAQAGAQLSQLMRTGGGNISTTALADAGISFDSSGKVQLDEKKLKAAIAADPAAVSALFTNGGKGIADQMAGRIDSLTGADSTLKREVASVGKEITNLNGKRAELSKALTAQANALVKLYTQQEQAGNNPALPGYTGPRSLFDMLA